MILIDEYESTAVRCESDGAKELTAALLAQVRKGTEVIGGEDGDPLTEETVATAVAWAQEEGFLNEAFDAIFLTEEEGEEGVACCFSSADRSCFAVAWPAGPDEWLGNGDAMVYKTAGLPVGVPVKGVDEMLLEEVPED